MVAFTPFFTVYCRQEELVEVLMSQFVWQRSLKTFDIFCRAGKIRCAPCPPPPRPRRRRCVTNSDSFKQKIKNENEATNQPVVVFCLLFLVIQHSYLVPPQTRNSTAIEDQKQRCPHVLAVAIALSGGKKNAGEILRQCMYSHHI